MRIAPNKKDIEDYFVSWGWLIVLFVLASYVGWYLPITKIDEIKDYERINFFFECYGLKENTLEDDMTALLKADGVVETNVYSYAPNDSRIADYYDAFGSQSDFLVLTGDDLVAMFPRGESSGVAARFVPFSEDLKEAALPTSDYAFYQADGQDYALKVYDPNDLSYDATHPFGRLMDFSSGGSPTPSYYLLLNALTPNFRPFDSDGLTDNGVQALRFFLEEYGEAEQPNE